MIYFLFIPKCHPTLIILEKQPCFVSIGYSPAWRQLWAYNTREIIGRGCSPRQLSQGCYMPITASKQGSMYFIPW